MNVRACEAMEERVPPNYGCQVITEGILEEEGVESGSEGRIEFGEDKEGIPGCQQALEPSIHLCLYLQSQCVLSLCAALGSQCFCSEVVSWTLDFPYLHKASG